jgi:hypothetical protein
VAAEASAAAKEPAQTIKPPRATQFVAVMLP